MFNLTNLSVMYFYNNNVQVWQCLKTHFDKIWMYLLVNITVVSFKVMSLASCTLVLVPTYRINFMELLLLAIKTTLQSFPYRVKKIHTGHYGVFSFTMTVQMCYGAIPWIAYKECGIFIYFFSCSLFTTTAACQ